MDTRIALAAGCAALVAGLTGCSADDGGHGRVSLGGADVGTVTAVQCATDGERTTITLDGEKKTTVVVNGADDLVVESVNIGEAGADDGALAYLKGVTPTPASITHDDAAGYRITGTGMGTSATDPGAPVDTPFEVEASCP